MSKWRRKRRPQQHDDLGEESNDDGVERLAMVIHTDANTNNEQVTLILEAAGEANIGDISTSAESWMMRPIVILILRLIGWPISITMAAGFTLGLFYFMQSLIATGEQLDKRVTVIKIVDATMPEIELVVIEESDKPEPIEEITEQQPEPPDKHFKLDSGPALNIERATVEIDTGMELSIAAISAIDGDFLPLVTISPQYPALATRLDIEGWCIVSFTVDGQGNVVEGSVEVVDAEPPFIFDRSSIRAASRFKFQPRVKDGVGVEVAGVQYLFRFIFED